MSAVTWKALPVHRDVRGTMCASLLVALSDRPYDPRVPNSKPYFLIAAEMGGGS